MALRSFIAIEIPEDIRRALGRCQEALRAPGVKVRWVHPAVMHLTTKFLGDVAEQDVPAICDVLEDEARNVKPLALEVATLGTFPPRGAPRVVWAGITGDVERLADVVKRIDDGIADAVGIQPEHRRFHPHLTLGRVKSTHHVDKLVAMIAEKASTSFGSFTADAVTLFMSKLSSEGPTHTPMATVSFEG